MKFVTPKVFLIAQTVLNREAIRAWLAEHEVDYAKISHTLPGEDGAQLVALAGKRCYLSFAANLQPNVTKVREDAKEYMDNILKSGHGSVLECSTYSFAIENVSRVFTAELNRHRAGVGISEGSMRYIRFDDIKVVETATMRADGMFRDFIGGVFKSIETAYKTGQEVLGFDKVKDFSTKKVLTSALRRIVGMGVASGGVWTFNARALRHIIELRTTAHAEEEIREVFDQIATIMVEREPLLFGDFTKQEDGSWLPKYHKV